MSGVEGDSIVKTKCLTYPYHLHLGGNLSTEATFGGEGKRVQKVTLGVRMKLVLVYGA